MRAGSLRASVSVASPWTMARLGRPRTRRQRVSVSVLRHGRGNLLQDLGVTTALPASPRRGEAFTDSQFGAACMPPSLVQFSGRCRARTNPSGHLACPVTSGHATPAVSTRRRDQEKGEIDGVEQLTRYLELLNRDPLLPTVCGIFAAQEIKLQAKTLAEDRAIRCVLLDYDSMRGIEREGTLF
jgi:Endonuclease NucS C-terminal domain